MTTWRSKTTGAVLAVVALVLGTTVAAHAADQLVLDPTEGIVGSTVGVSGTLDCPDQSPGNNLLVRFTDPDAIFQTGTNLVYTPMGAGEAFATDITVPSELASLQPPFGIIPVAVVPGAYQVEVSCTASSSPSVPTITAPFTVASPCPSDGSIVGTVTEQGTGTPLADVTPRVRAHPANTFAGSARTGAAGTYAVDCLPPGDYVVVFLDDSGTHLKTFNGGVWPFSAASPVTVTGGGTTVVDAALTPAGTMQGTLTEEGTGTPLAGATVRIRHAGTNTFAKATRTAADGSWSVVLPVGDYLVLFDDGGVHQREFADDKPGPIVADVKTVTQGGTVVVDAALAP